MASSSLKKMLILIIFFRPEEAMLGTGESLSYL